MHADAAHVDMYTEPAAVALPTDANRVPSLQSPTVGGICTKATRLDMLKDKGESARAQQTDSKQANYSNPTFAPLSHSRDRSRKQKKDQNRATFAQSRGNLQKVTEGHGTKTKDVM
jgi:hypothetical protein